ncbi:peptide deformylase 1B, chloroplastic/mitochondrial [Aristolochia californica]|uniref:peptide deformylase 1B, chloroplastic/mitochondrial n=1 Tax=Aristolochia californica TaxID=171875 RepID=UPI0035D6FDDE
MGCSLLLRSSPLSQALLPLLSGQARFAAGLSKVRERPFSSSSFIRTSGMRVSAQARRRFSAKEEDLVTSSDMQLESPLRIVEYPDPILRAKNKRLATFDENLKKLVDEMFDIMYKTDGIGLSAPQVGVNVQLLVFNPAGERGVGEELVLVNPKVYKFSQKTVLFDEGCLSFPGIYADVERPVSLKVDARDVTGARFTMSLSGLPARVFQHEFDHLQGILFFDRMTDEVLDSIRPELQALEKKYETLTGLASPEKVENRKGKKDAMGIAKKEVAGFGKS